VIFPLRGPLVVAEARIDTGPQAAGRWATSPDSTRQLLR
jgi:hypothetical protein